MTFLYSLKGKYIRETLNAQAKYSMKGVASLPLSYNSCLYASAYISFVKRIASATSPMDLRLFMLAF